MVITSTHTAFPGHPAAASESAVVSLALRGDRDARERLARSCQRQAFLFALQLTGNRDDALDVAQDALLRFFASLSRFDTSRPVRPWLLRIVRNLVRDRRRRARVRRTEPLQKDDDGPILEPVDHADDPEAVVNRREMQRLVWGALQELSPEHREILVLRDYQDMPYAAIAEALGVAKGTVMSRLHRARVQLGKLVRARMHAHREVDNG